MQAFYFASGALTTPMLILAPSSPNWGWLIVPAAASLIAGAALEWAQDQRR